MAGVFQNIDPHPPHRPASVYPPPLVRGEDTLAGWRGGGGGSIFWKTPGTALHSTYVSTLWVRYGYPIMACRHTKSLIFILKFTLDKVQVPTVSRSKDIFNNWGQVYL
jgi:hypothetical protein